MHPKLDKKLCADFPLLYGDRNGNMQNTCMVWGFDCNDGWYQLIYDLSSKLEPLIKMYLETATKEEAEYYPRAMQVKEKFGTLRFYMTSATDEMYKLIQEAEDKSGEICETCGKPGKCRNGGWITCLCDECSQKRYPEIAVGEDEVPPM